MYQNVALASRDERRSPSDRTSQPHSYRSYDTRTHELIPPLLVSENTPTAPRQHIPQMKELSHTSPRARWTQNIATTAPPANHTLQQSAEMADQSINVTNPDLNQQPRHR